MYTKYLLLVHPYARKRFLYFILDLTIIHFCRFLVRYNPCLYIHLICVYRIPVSPKLTWIFWQIHNNCKLPSAFLLMIYYLFADHQIGSSQLSRLSRILVLLLDCYAEIGALIRCIPCQLICARHLLRSRAVTHRIFFSEMTYIFRHASVTCS